MLDALRKRAGSWIVKVLLVLLVVSFAIWGIGDIFYGGGRNPTVATVGDSEILASELNEAFDRAVANLQRQLGTTIDRDRAIQLGLLQQTLQDMIRRRLVDLRARDMGLTVTDDTLRAMITENPAFQTAGQFDRGRFEQVLLANGLSEAGYLAGLRQDAVRATLAGSLAAPVTVPEILVDTLYRYQNERRGGRYLTVTFDSIDDLPEPSEEEIASFHEAHQARFTAPEYRALVLVTLTPEDLIEEVAVDDAQIEAAYQDRIADYRTPERRTVEQLLAPNREVLEQASRRVAEGASFAEVASELSDSGLVADSLGEVAEGELPPEFDGPIFELAEGDVSAPIESPFGWHLFRVSAIQPEAVVPLAEVRDQLARELALAEARDRLPTFANQLDDELAAGADLATAAATLGLETVEVPAIDRQGRDPSGAPVAGLPDWPDILRVAFETSAAETSLLEETDDGNYFVVEVEEVTPPHLKPIDEVRDELVAAWQEERRRELAKERAGALRAELAPGDSLDALAEAADAEVIAIEPVGRSDDGSAQGLNRAVVRALFATEPGAVAAEPVELADGFAIVATSEVMEADPADDPDGVERLKTELARELRDDVLAQFDAQLRQDYPVEIDAAEVNRMMGDTAVGAG